MIARGVPDSIMLAVDLVGQWRSPSASIAAAGLPGLSPHALSAIFFDQSTLVEPDLVH